MNGPPRPAAFSERVVVLLLAQVVATGMGIANGFLFARLLGPGAKGDYYLLILPPATIMVFIQFGLPQALGFYAARGRTLGLLKKAVGLAAALSLVAIVATAALLPTLRESIFRNLDPVLIRVTLSAIPLLAIATFTTSILTALKAVRWYAAVQLTQAFASTTLIVCLVGVVGLGVRGAVATYIAVSVIGMVGCWAGAARAVATVPRPRGVPLRRLFRFGLPLYPGAVTTFLSYRIDAYLLAALVPDVSAPLGFYSMAVTMAEMVFLVPNAVSSVFFPHVAGATRSDADRDVLVVARVTLLLTAGTAVVLVPMAIILIEVFLPAFSPALLPLYVLLPGAVALSIFKVVSDYVAALGRTAITSAVTMLAFAVNVVANLLLIPHLGIIGAAAASLLSYSASAIVITLIAARLAHARMSDFWLPRPADVRFAVVTILGLAKRLTGRMAGDRSSRP